MKRLATSTASCILFVAAAFVLAVSGAQAGNIKVLTSGGFAAALAELAPQFERASGQKVIIIEGATLGTSPTSIPSRMRRGEVVDAVIMSRTGIDSLIESGRIVAGSRIELGRSGIGMAVRKGTPKPDISTVDALSRTLVRAQSIAISSSISGVYLRTELFQRLGIADRVLPKLRTVEGERVGAVVARGGAEMGFQQTSELVTLPGIDYVGPLPREVQRVTVFAAGISANAAEPEGAKRLIAFLKAPASRSAITRSGLDLIPSR